MHARTSTVDPDVLARNLRQLAEEQEGRLRRITIRNQRNWFASWFRSQPAPGGARLWWVAPASWAVVFSIGFLVTDWIWEAFGQFLGRLGL